MTTITTGPEAQVLKAVPTQLFIGGEWRPGGAGVFTVADPATGQQLAQVAKASIDDARAALDAAVEMATPWAAYSPRTRSDILRRAYELVVERAEQLALLTTLEMGKPVAESRAEALYGAEFFRWFSEEAVRISGRYSIAPAGKSRLLTREEPVGPCLLITPWNFPVATGARKLAPALAAGCTVVVKPAEHTPLSVLALVEILHEAGLPAGVLNVVTTDTPSAPMSALISDSRLRKLSFTGSTHIGRHLMKEASGRLLRLSMELGGNAAFIVFSDADLDDAVEGAVIAKMRNMGEACTAANRFYAHATIADEFARRLATRLKAMKLGRGTESGTDVGPLISGKQRDRVAQLVDGAVRQGARVLVGGSTVAGPGYFYEPTVLTNVPPSSEILGCEIFGPVAPVVSFGSEAEAVTAANEGDYGLVAYVYTRDLSRAMRVADVLETGMVGLNTGIVSNAAAPFGGIKQSGFGREGGPEGIREYLATKYVAVSV